MNKQRKMRQKCRKKLGKLADEIMHEAATQVDAMKKRVNAAKMRPINLVGKPTKPPGLTRKKRQSNKMGRFAAGGCVVDNTPLQDGLRQGFEKKGVWSSTLRKWFFPKGNEPNNVR